MAEPTVLSRPALVVLAISHNHLAENIAGADDNAEASLLPKSVD